MSAKHSLILVALALSGCTGMDAERVTQAFAMGLAGGAAIYSSGQQYTSYYAAQVRDYSWEWDQQHGADGYTPVWVCRGVQTGQYSSPSNCLYKAKVDFQWPGL